ncbi:hypothetical protein Glove_290g94 [Diversispora epigaea]|uniref:Uncharacterized protein n=1 Tax=Diversispora epigaea TaxID=1348612 RepID=A0A397I7H8_9GLOM|nr:hypothetical protein Glove_290g94 [Diversispora epigaea]
MGKSFSKVSPQARQPAPATAENRKGDTNCKLETYKSALRDHNQLLELCDGNISSKTSINYDTLIDISINI